MGITQVDSTEAERFEEGLDSEFYDPTEESPDMPTNMSNLGHGPCCSHGGCGSASLQKCFNLLSNAECNSPAPCHSGVKSDKIPDPQHVETLDIRYKTPWNGCRAGMLDESVFLARPLENNLTFWFISLTAHNLCCLLGMVGE